MIQFEVGKEYLQSAWWIVICWTYFVKSNSKYRSILHTNVVDLLLTALTDIEQTLSQTL